VLVEESGNGGDSISYGIRVLSVPSSDYAGWTFDAAAVETTTDVPRPTVLEPALQGSWASWPPSATTAAGTTAPAQAITLDTGNLPTTTNRLNRNVVGVAVVDNVASVAIIGNVNWIRIHLP